MLYVHRTVSMTVLKPSSYGVKQKNFSFIFTMWLQCKLHACTSTASFFAVIRYLNVAKQISRRAFISQQPYEKPNKSRCFSLPRINRRQLEAVFGYPIIALRLLRLSRKTFLCLKIILTFRPTIEYMSFFEDEF